MSARGDLARWGVALLALLYLNAVLSFQNLWPTPWPRPVPELSCETLLIFAGLAWLRARGRRLGLRAAGGLALLLVVLILLRYAEVSAPPLFGRGLNFYWDLRHVPNLLVLAWQSMPAWRFVLIGLGVGLLLALLWVLNAAAVVAAERALTGPRLRAVAFLLPVLAGLLYAGSFVPGLAALKRLFSVPVTVIAANHVGRAVGAMRMVHAGPEELDRLLGPPLPETPLPAAGPESGDVVVIFIESYGTTLFDEPDRAAAIEPAFAAFERSLAAAGWHAASRRLISPTFGGGSWLAHGSLLGGAMLTDQGRYNLFLASGRPTLVRGFGAAGYRTVAVMPGTQRQWPEGEAFGFDRIYDAEALGYPGPDFGYWRIPDQFTLHRFESAELASRQGGPLFALVVLITTHMPFHPLPPHVADWDRLADGTAYDPAATAALVAEDVDWSTLGARYVEAMARTFQSLAEFLQDHVAPDSLVVVLGDHQPPGVVTGEHKPWTVPIHLLARDPARLEGFLARGYVEGLRPAPQSAAPMAGFAEDFLASLANRPR